MIVPKTIYYTPVNMVRGFYFDTAKKQKFVSFSKKNRADPSTLQHRHRIFIGKSQDGRLIIHGKVIFLAGK